MTRSVARYALRLALLAALGATLGSRAATAQVVCQPVTPLNLPTYFVCAPSPDALRNLQVIDSGLQKQTGTFVPVPEAERPSSWPLGSGAIQSCRFCLTPDRQNITRMKALQAASGGSR